LRVAAQKITAKHQGFLGGQTAQNEEKGTKGCRAAGEWIKEEEKTKKRAEATAGRSAHHQGDPFPFRKRRKGDTFRQQSAPVGLL